MKVFKPLVGPTDVPDPGVFDVRQGARRVLTEYVLNMAITALALGELEPLYEQYQEDARLSDEDREDLARAYLLLHQMSTVQNPDPA